MTTTKRGRRPGTLSIPRRALDQAMLAALRIRPEGRKLAAKGEDADNIRQAARLVARFYKALGKSIGVSTILKHWGDCSPYTPGPTEAPDGVDSGVPNTVRVAARILCFDGRRLTPGDVLAWYRSHLAEGGRPFLHPFDLARAFFLARKKVSR